MEGGRGNELMKMLVCAVLVKVSRKDLLFPLWTSIAEQIDRAKITITKKGAPCMSVPWMMQRKKYLYYSSLHLEKLHTLYRSITAYWHITHVRTFSLLLTVRRDEYTWLTTLAYYSSYFQLDSPKWWTLKGRQAIHFMM